jgi:phosphomannomutase
LRTTIADVKADLGVAFDGDGDRMCLVDRHGKQVPGDMATALVVKALLTKHPGETVMYDLTCSRSVPELVERMNGRAIRTPVRHTSVRPLMKKHDAVFRGKRSGHFYFRDNWFADSGLIALLLCLEIISSEGRSLDEIIKDINPYVQSDEIDVGTDDPQGKIEAVSQAFAGGEQDRLDGLTVRFDDYWFNLYRPDAKRVLRLNVEADSEPLLERKKEEVLGVIRS